MNRRLLLVDGNRSCILLLSLLLVSLQGGAAVAVSDKERRFSASRFWPKVAITEPDACWEWRGNRTWGGYGMFKLQGRDQGAHRAAWILTVGEIPEGDGYHGICVLHVCDNRACVNPRHLLLGTHQDNMDDREQKSRGNRPKKATNLKLTEADVLEIRRLAADGARQVDIAKRFAIDRGRVSKIVNRKMWDWV